MSKQIVALRAQLEKDSDAELLREMVSFSATRLMQLKAESLAGAPHGQRSEDRIARRKSYLDCRCGPTNGRRPAHRLLNVARPGHPAE